MVDETMDEVEGAKEDVIISRDQAEHRKLLREVVGIAGEAEVTMNKLAARMKEDPVRLSRGIDFLVISGYFLLLLAIYGFFWLFMTISGYSLLFLAIIGYFGLFLTFSGYS